MLVVFLTKIWYSNCVCTIIVTIYITTAAAAATIHTTTSLESYSPVIYHSFDTVLPFCILCNHTFSYFLHMALMPNISFSHIMFIFPLCMLMFSFRVFPLWPLYLWYLFAYILNQNKCFHPYNGLNRKATRKDWRCV